MIYAALNCSQHLSTLEALERGFPACDRSSRRSLRRSLQSDSQRVYFYDIGDQIVGAVIVHIPMKGYKAYVSSLIVSDKHRGEGIGLKLAKHVEETAKSMGYETLILDVRVRNKAAILLYNKLGYVRVKRIKGYYADGTDAYHMTKDLGGAK